jgi:predicted transcriptional regulator
VNKYFEGTVIYRYEEPIGSHVDAATLTPMVKLSISKTKYLVEERFKKDPVAQYNLQLLSEKKAELKEKKEEYLKMRNWDNDDILISLSTSSTLDIDEYKEKIEDLKDEIEDLKDEIEEIKYELDEIRDSIEEEIEDEEWEREMEIF